VAERESLGYCRGGTSDSEHMLRWVLVRKAPVQIGIAEFWMGSSSASCDFGARL